MDKDEYISFNKIKKKLSKLSISRTTNLKKIVKKENPDIVISFLPEPSLRIMFLKQIDKNIRKIPVIISERGDPSVVFKNKLIYHVMKNLYKKMDGFIAQTDDAKEYFKNIIKAPSTVIANPINSKFISKECSNNRDKTIVSVGRLENQKNNKLLIDAFRIVCQNTKEYKLLFYGEGKLKDDLVEYVKQLGLTNEVVFMGKSNTIEKDIYNAGMFVLSSNYEGMPNALMEAMALGLPCISTDCPVGGPRFLINNEENGLLVKVGDTQELSNAILRLINDNVLLQKIAKNALKISDKLNPNVINQQWEEFILKIARKDIKEE